MVCFRFKPSMVFHVVSFDLGLILFEQSMNTMLARGIETRGTIGDAHFWRMVMTGGALALRDK